MNRPRIVVSLAVLLLTVIACQPAEQSMEQNDFAVLARPADGFSNAEPGYKLVFPYDHGAHNDFRIEWWYLTANLEDENGRIFGGQWTLFRYALDPLDDTETPYAEQLFMAHMAITTPDDHFSFQRYARGAKPGASTRAGVRAIPFSAWLDDWVLESTTQSWLPLKAHARQDDIEITLMLDSDQAIVLQGDNGFSAKNDSGSGSYYYSQPFLSASGEIRLGNERIAVTGNAWLDREWSSRFLTADQSGWDWFSIHLDSGEKLMVFQLRQNNDAAGNFLHAVLIGTDGVKTTVNVEDVHLRVLEKRKVEGRQLPLAWQLDIPSLDRQMTIRALHDKQWMKVDFPYFEGVVTVTGNGRENSGKGYMELTGYTETSDDGH